MTFCIVSGIINRFYNKWHSSLFNLEPERPQLNYDDLNENKEPLNRHQFRTIKQRKNKLNSMIANRL